MGMDNGAVHSWGTWLEDGSHPKRQRRPGRTDSNSIENPSDRSNPTSGHNFVTCTSTPETKKIPLTCSCFLTHAHSCVSLDHADDEPRVIIDLTEEPTASVARSAKRSLQQFVSGSCSASSIVTASSHERQSVLSGLISAASAADNTSRLESPRHAGVVITMSPRRDEQPIRQRPLNPSSIPQNRHQMVHALGRALHAQNESSFLVPSSHQSMPGLRVTEPRGGTHLNRAILPPTMAMSNMTCHRHDSVGPMLYGDNATGRYATASSTAGPMRRLDDQPVVLRPAQLLVHPMDRTTLSVHQAFLRHQMQVFCATHEDVMTYIRGRNKAIHFGQVGLRCRHCAHRPAAQRGKGSTYYPSSTIGIYQAAQNMSLTHFSGGSSSSNGQCPDMPDTIKAKLADLVAAKGDSSASSAGRTYWAASARQMGLVDTPMGIYLAS
jgi:hypothetical protein